MHRDKIHTYMYIHVHTVPMVLVHVGLVDELTANATPESGQ